MNKYYKLSNLLILVSVIFASFFVWKAQAGALSPKIKLVTIEGQAEEFKDVNFYGQVYEEGYMNSTSFSFKENKIEYSEDKSLMRQIDSYNNQEIDEYVSNYRSFMRGKNPNSNQYFSNDQWLIHAALRSDFHWANDRQEEMIISILDKESKEEEKYTISLEEFGGYFSIRALHFIDSELSIVMDQYTSSGEEKNFITSFDIHHPENLLTEKVDFSDQMDSESYLRFENKKNNSDRFMIFQVIKNITISEYEEVPEIKDYLFYDSKKEEIMKLPSIEEGTVLTDQEKIYLVQNKEDVIELSIYDFEQNEFQEMVSLDVFSQIIGQEEEIQYQDEFNERISLSNGKLYLYGADETQGSYLPVFQIIDIKTGETLFLGKLDYLNPSTNGQQEISIYQYRVN